MAGPQQQRSLAMLETAETALEEPPDYTSTDTQAYRPPDAPTYESSIPIPGQRSNSTSSSARPLIWRLRQLSRKHATIVPLTPHAALPSYDIHEQSFASLRKKPDFILLRGSPTCTTASTSDSSSPSSRRSSAPSPAPISSFRFDRDGPLPWIPRATTHIHTSTPPRVGAMQLGQAADLCWHTEVAERACRWSVRRMPMRLVLLDDDSLQQYASFVFSEHGTAAARGASVGTLEVEGWFEGASQTVFAQVVTSLLVAHYFWRNDGKVLRNDEGMERLWRGREGRDEPVATLVPGGGGFNTAAVAGAGVGAVGSGGLFWRF